MSKLASDNQTRVAELCDRQVQESLAQTSRNTRAILGSIQPLNLPKPKGPIVEPPPSSKDAKGAGSTPAPGKQGDDAGPKKAPPPILGGNRPLVVKAPPKGQGSGAKSLPTQDGAQAPTSFKPTLPPHLVGKNVSPRGHPPPRILPRSNNPSRQSSIAGGNTPRSARSEDTADLEEKLRKKKEANVQDLMNRTVHSMMNGTHQDNKNLVIINGVTAPVEIVDGEIEPQVKTHLLLIHRRTIEDHAHQSRTRRHRHSRRQRSRSRRESRSERRRRGSSEEEKRSRSKGGRVIIDRPRIKEGGFPPPHQKKRDPKLMRKSGSPVLPNLFKQSQRNLNRGIRHHYHHQGQQRHLLYNRHLNQFNGKLPKRCQPYVPDMNMGRPLFRVRQLHAHPVRVQQHAMLQGKSRCTTQHDTR